MNSSGKGISFSFNMKAQPKKGMMNVSIGAFQKKEEKNEKIMITEVVGNTIKEEKEKKPELIIPLKQPSWITKAKERVEKEKKVMQLKQLQKEKINETSESTISSEESKKLDEARISLLTDLYKKEEEEEGDPNLVIPLHDKSEHGMNKQQPIIMKNRMPGYDTMDKEEYFKMELDTLPEENDVHSDSFTKVRIEDFGRAMLRGMGWDGNSTVNSSVYEIKPRPDRLGLGAMPLALDKPQRISAVKKSISEKVLEKDHTGVKNEWGNNNEIRIGLQVGIINGGFKGKQGHIIETPRLNSNTLKVLIEGEKTVYQMNLSDVMILNDLTKVQSFNNQYNPKSTSIPNNHSSSNNTISNSSSKKSRSRSRSRHRKEDEYHHSNHSSHRDHHHHHHSHHSSHH